MHGITAENKQVDGHTGYLRDALPFVVDGPEDLARLRLAWADMDSTPVLRLGRESGLDQSWPGFDVRTLLDGDNSSGRISYHDIQLDPRSGLPFHYQDTADTFIYVVEGEIQLTVGCLSESSGAHSAAYVPSHTTQGFRNEGPGVARLFVAYLPAGADRAFSEAHDVWLSSGTTDPERYLTVLRKYGFCFDSGEPLENDQMTNKGVKRLEFDVESIEDFDALREAWRQRKPVPKLIHDRSDLPVVGVTEPSADKERVRSRVLVNGDEDSGCAVFFDGFIEPAYTAGPHHQPTEEEAFYILEGEFELTCGNQTRRVGPGAFGFAPRNATHGFSNASPGQYSRTLTLNSPAGHERGFEMTQRERAELNRMGIKELPDRVWNLIEAHGWNIHDGPVIGS